MINVNNEIQFQLNQFIHTLNVENHFLSVLNKMIDFNNKGIFIKGSENFNEIIKNYANYFNVHTKINEIDITEYRHNKSNLRRLRSSLKGKKSRLSEQLTEWEPILIKLKDNMNKFNTNNQSDAKAQSFLLKTLSDKVSYYKNELNKVNTAIECLIKIDSNTLKVNGYIKNAKEMTLKVIIKKYFELLNQELSEMFKEKLIIHYSVREVLNDFFYFEDKYNNTTFKQNILSFFEEYQHHLKAQIICKKGNSDITLKLFGNEIIPNVDVYHISTENPKKELEEIQEKHPGLVLIMQTLKDIANEREYMDDWENIFDTINQEMISLYDEKVIIRLMELNKQYKDYFLETAKAKEFYYRENGLNYLSELFRGEFTKHSIQIQNKIFMFGKPTE